MGDRWEYCFLRGGYVYFMDRTAPAHKAPDSGWSDLGIAGWELVVVTPNYEYYFQNAVKKAGLPHQRFHDMRHACASLLLAMGVPDHVVMNILGHSSISITKNIYAHVYPSMQREAADKMGQALFGASPEK